MDATVSQLITAHREAHERVQAAYADADPAAESEALDDRRAIAAALRGMGRRDVAKLLREEQYWLVVNANNARANWNADEERSDAAALRNVTAALDAIRDRTATN